MGVNEPTSARDERIRQISVLSNCSADIWESGERSIGLEDKNRQNGCNRDVVEPVPAYHGCGDQREYGLVFRLSGSGGADIVGPADPGNSGQQDRKHANNERQSTPCNLYSRVAKGCDSGTDCFNPCHGSAAVCKRPQNE